MYIPSIHSLTLIRIASALKKRGNEEEGEKRMDLLSLLPYKYIYNNYIDYLEPNHRERQVDVPDWTRSINRRVHSRTGEPTSFFFPFRRETQISSKVSVSCIM